MTKPFESKLTSEFEEQDWEDFRSAWIEQYTKELVRFGANERDAQIESAFQWDRYSLKEGWRSRDESITERRLKGKNE